MNRGPIQIQVSSCLGGELGKEVSRTIHQIVKQHLGKGRKPKTARLKVRLEQFGLKNHLALASVSISGTVNGRQVHKKFTRRRDLRTKTAGGIVPGLVIYLTSTAISNAFISVTGNDPTKRKPVECLEECLADVRLLIDKTLGRSNSHATNLWNVLFWVRWAGIPIVLLLLLGGGVIAGIDDYSILVPVAFFMTFFFFGIVYLFSLVFMPANFYRNDPRGLKVLAKTGVSNIWMMKALALFLGSGALLAFIGVIALFTHVLTK